MDYSYKYKKYKLKYLKLRSVMYGGDESIVQQPTVNTPPDMPSSESKKLGELLADERWMPEPGNVVNVDICKNDNFRHLYTDSNFRQLLKTDPSMESAVIKFNPKCAENYINSLDRKRFMDYISEFIVKQATGFIKAYPEAVKSQLKYNRWDTFLDGEKPSTLIANIQTEYIHPINNFIAILKKSPKFPEYKNELAQVITEGMESNTQLWGEYKETYTDWLTFLNKD